MVVQHVDLAASDLIEPDGGIVAVADVPRGVDRAVGIVWDAPDAPGVRGLAHLDAIERPQYGRFERALVFLVVLVLRQLRAQGVKLGRRQDARGAGRQAQAEPIRRSLRGVEGLVELVPALGRPADHRPASSVRERRADDVAPDTRAKVAVLVQVDAVEAEAAHGTVTRHYRQHQQGKATSTNPIASIFAWTGGLKFRGKFDETPEVTRFAETLEEVCIQTVEDGHMTKDLAILIGPDQAWMTTEQFFEQVRANLEIKMGSWM